MADRGAPPSHRWGDNALPGLIGVGYQGRTIGALIDELRAAGVTLLVDVRLNAISRKPGLSKRALGEALATAGIAYLHRPELGNPRDNRPGFGGSPHDVDAARARYARRLAQPAAIAAVDALVEEAQRVTVAVLCFESDPTRCHRFVLLQTARMRAAGVPVEQAGHGPDG